MKKFRCFISVIIVVLIMSILPTSLTVYGVNEEAYGAVVSADFENGSYEGWSPLGGKSEIAVTNESAYSGSISLTTQNRQSAWSGPCLNITDSIVPGEEYLFRAYVKSNKAESITVLMTLKYTDDKSQEKYVNMATKTVGNESWDFFEARETLPANISDAIFYFETIDGLDDFSIDCVSIFGYGKKKPVYEENETELEFDFEDGLDGWIPRGELNVETAETFSYTGDSSLCVSEKKDSWNTAMVRINMVEPGVNYTYSAYVMSMERKGAQDRSYSIRLQYSLDSKETYSVIKSKVLKNGIWSKISGDFVLPDNAENVYFYVIDDECEMDYRNLKFYIDDVEIFDSTMAKKIQRINITLIIVGSVIVLIIIFFIMRYFVKKNKEVQLAILRARLDAMTGALNRNTYKIDFGKLEEDIERIKKIYITACDVNFLKYINDNYGHDSGDKAIMRCAAVLLKTVGKKGNVYRVGGDEFVCITDVDLTGVLKNEFIKESADYKGYPFSAAVGTAHYDSAIDTENPDVKAILARSDKAMYDDKVEIKKHFDF